MALPQWLRSLFGLPSPEVADEYTRRERSRSLHADGTDLSDWRENGRHGESLEEFRLRTRRASEPVTDDGHRRSTSYTRENFDRVRTTPTPRGITPTAAHARQERFDSMYRADVGAYQRARQRELDAYEQGVRDQAMGDFVGDLVQTAAANEAIERAEDRADRAEERLEDERHEHTFDDMAQSAQVEQQADVVYQAPEPNYPEPTPAPEYQAPEPTYSTPDPAPSYDPGPSSYDSGSSSYDSGSSGGSDW